MLDSGTQASFITENKARALMLPIRTSQSTIQALSLGSAHSQRTCGLLPTTGNHTVDVNPEITPRLRNAIPPRKLDSSRTKHLHNLGHVNPGFISPGKIKHSLWCRHN